MKLAAAALSSCLVVASATGVIAQDAAKSSGPPVSQPKSATVPVALDHNRVVIDVYLPLPNGSTERVRGWVDNGNPDLEMSRRAAMLMGLNVTCNDKACSAPPPREITIGEMKISLAAVKEAKIPLKPVSAASVMAAGMNAEINVPSSVLRDYDVLVDFPDRKFTIAQPGTLKFKGVSSKVSVNSQNGLVQVPAQIEGKKYNLGLDVGASISFLSEELFDKLLNAHPGLPHMTGAVGPANMWGLDQEPKWKVLRVDRLQYGPLYLTDVPMANFLKEGMSWFEKRAGIATAGLMGSNALLNYRIGIDYTHATVYFDLGSTFKPPDFDVIGLTLRPEDDGRFTILGVVDFDGKPSIPEIQAGDHLVAVDSTPVLGSTMGQVWALLKGQPGQERTLTIERAGKQFAVGAKVHHFLGDEPEETLRKEKSKR